MLRTDLYAKIGQPEWSKSVTICKIDRQLASRLHCGMISGIELCTQSLAEKEVSATESVARNVRELSLLE